MAKLIYENKVFCKDGKEFPDEVLGVIKIKLWTVKICHPTTEMVFNTNQVESYQSIHQFTDQSMNHSMNLEPLQYRRRREAPIHFSPPLIQNNYTLGKMKKNSLVIQRSIKPIYKKKINSKCKTHNLQKN